MDLESIDSAICSYREILGEDDIRRLDFFRSVWGRMSELADGPDVSGLPYEMPSEPEIKDLYAESIPILSKHPVSIGITDISDAAAAISEALITGDVYPGSIAEELKDIRWKDAVSETDISLAGSDPSAWLASLSERLSVRAFSDEALLIATVAALLALSLFLEKPSKAIMGALDGGHGLPHSLTCPVCGSDPSMSVVGGRTASEGRGRGLICSQCGAEWEFERIRCARCGTQEQTRLVYRHIGEDDAHRLAICEKCGGTMRTLFLEDAEAPYSPLVEDVVMARLDALSRSLDWQ